MLTSRTIELRLNFGNPPSNLGDNGGGGGGVCVCGGGTVSCICYGPYQNSVSINTARAVLILTEGPVSIDADRFARAVLILPTCSL